jgi:hypothetical protein
VVDAGNRDVDVDVDTNESADVALGGIVGLNAGSSVDFQI